MFDNNDVVQQIKSALNITDIIGEKVSLRKSSRGWSGLCPFHNERTASFHVFEDTQSYYCFGCHAAGDIFTFVMRSEGLEFSEALEFLAARAGIRLPDKTQRYSDGKKNISEREILELAQNHFVENLFNNIGKAAQVYILSRGLEVADVKRFHLGYSIPSWDGLVRELRNKGVKDSQMLKLGIAIQGKRGLYDRFRGRVMFPISDTVGHVIAFGGRLIDGDGAKYINSPESEIYSKRRNLYLFNEARKSIREKQRSILAEGYMDAIRLHKCGFTEAVASLGTSLTSEQANLLSKFADRCYICYDSDTAGQTAAIRGMYILQENGLDVYVVRLPEGKDPDEFLSSNPPEEFEKALNNSRPLVLAHIEALRPSIENPLTNKSAVRELFEGLSRLKVEDVLRYRSTLSEVTLIPPAEIEARLSEFRRRGKIQNDKEPDKPINKNPVKYNPLEAAFCAMLFDYPELRLRIKPEEIFKLLNNSLTQQIAIAALTEDTNELQQRWLELGEINKQEFLAGGREFLREVPFETASELWDVVYNDIKKLAMKRRNNELKEKLLSGKATSDELMELSMILHNKNVV